MFKIWFATSQEGGRKKVVVVVEDVVACAVVEVVVVEQCDRRNLGEVVADNQTDQSQSCLQVAVAVVGTNVQSKYHHQ